MPESAGQPQVEAAVQVLRARGERVTPARRAVVELLASTAEHLSADEIAERVERAAPGVHRATVYRALATLGELDVVTHTHLGGHAAVYHLSLDAAAVADAQPHAHLQCTSCHRVIDIPADLLAPLVDELDARLTFRLDPQHTALLGRCASCRPSVP